MLVYFFGSGKAEGTREMRDVLGGKGANLAEMTNLGVPVPPGFTIACSVCVEYLRNASYPPSLRLDPVNQYRLTARQQVDGKYQIVTLPLPSQNDDVPCKQQ